MAELVLRTRSIGHKHLGDIVCAINDADIMYRQAQHLCLFDETGKRINGFIYDKYPLAEIFYKCTSRFQFRKLNSKEVLRVDLANQYEETISNIPNLAGEYINLHEFFRQRKLKKDLPIFGSPGKEIWYSSIREINRSRLETLWALIHYNYGHKFTEVCPQCGEGHSFWPAGEQELKSYLFVRCIDFDTFSKNVLQETDKDNVPRFKIRWDDREFCKHCKLDKKLVTDPNIKVDIRKSSPILSFYSDLLTMSEDREIFRFPVYDKRNNVEKYLEHI